MNEQGAQAFKQFMGAEYWRLLNMAAELSAKVAQLELEIERLTAETEQKGDRDDTID